MNVLGICVLVLGTETWGEAVFNFHTLPDIFVVLVFNKNNQPNEFKLERLTYNMVFVFIIIPPLI
jgi:hypothetical protein